MNMFNTIACATDCSPSASNALTVAMGLARVLGRNLSIIYVQEVVAGRAGLLVDPSSGDLDTLQRTAEELQSDGVDATVLASTAPTREAGRRIVDLAMRAGADVIVIGNRRHGPLSTMLLGSVASDLLQVAPCPILVVPSDPDPE
jgi:nucleotide-binding universal stress UspA family protein